MSFDHDQQISLSSSQWKLICNEFKLLKILDLGFNVSAGSVPDAICELMNLRYLRIRVTSTTLPSSIFELWNLQRLFIHGNPTYIMPKGSFRQQRLQQLIIQGRTTLPLCRVSPSSQPLLSLTVLSSVFPNETFESLVTNGYFPNLIKLGLFNSENNPLRSLLYLFRSLPRLEKLKMSFVDSVPSQYVFEGITEERNLSQNLKKLTLKTSIWSTNSIDMLGNFPNLQILRLRDIQIRNNREDMRLNGLFFSNMFPKLHTLHLENLKYFNLLELQENALLQLRNLFVTQGNLPLFLNCQRLWKLPNLHDVQFLRAIIFNGSSYSPAKLEQLKAQSKFRILVHHAQ